MNLKGKDYLMVAYRIQWFREVYPTGSMTSEIIKLEDNYAVVRASLSVPDAQGIQHVIASGIKREDAKHFPDFLEKAETGAFGRALATAGFGTQFCLQDLDEGDRLADSPLQKVEQSRSASTSNLDTETHPGGSGAISNSSSFNRNKKPKLANGSAAKADSTTTASSSTEEWQ